MSRLIKTITLSVLLLSSAIAKPVEKKKEIPLTLQMKRVSKKVKKLEKETKDMLASLKKLLELKSKKQKDFLNREIK